MGSKIVEQAKIQGAAFLSEAESKELLAQFGVPIGKQLVTRSLDEATAFAKDAGYPLVLKGSGRTLLHKTEMGLVNVGIRDEDDLRARFNAMLEKLPEEADGILLSPQADNRREFIAGLSNDPQFGPVVMFGLGGIFTEALKDVVFRVAPIQRADAEDMLDGIKSASLLGEVRGLPAGLKVYRR